MIEQTLCQCYHSESEHDGNNCKGESYDQGFNIGCYCAGGFRAQTSKWIESQKEYYEASFYREKPSLYRRFLKLIGL